MRMRKPFLILGILLVGIIGYVAAYPILNANKNPQGQLPGIQAPKEPKPLSFVVVIDNAPETRPQPGLSEADLVIETLAEGGATRFLAFYSDREVQAIGPVRSARPYFIDLAHAFNVPLVHSGGSKEALARIAADASIKDINEFFNEKYFWRDRNLKAPYNLFTSYALINELMKKKNWQTKNSVYGWLVRDDLANQSPTASEINVNFSSPSFAVTYRYDAALNFYQRRLAGRPHFTAKNVVILYTTSSVIDKNLLTIDLETLGSGKALIFRNGGVLQARWQRLTSESPLRLLDADGSLVVLNNGSTWFAVIDQQGSVSWK